MKKFAQAALTLTLCACQPYSAVTPKHTAANHDERLHSPYAGQWHNLVTNACPSPLSSIVVDINGNFNYSAGAFSITGFIDPNGKMTAAFNCVANCGATLLGQCESSSSCAGTVKDCKGNYVFTLVR